MTEPQTCPECGATLPNGAADQPCQACLMKLGLASWVGRRDANTEVHAAGTDELPSNERLAERLPQFEILELVGSGGMGAVYRARQKSLDRIVALKIIRPQVAQEGDFAERFTREARAMAKLNHANILHIHDFGHIDGFYYFVMEFVDGANLRHLIESKEIASTKALSLVSQICDALEYAHREGVVHRDIKPENILVNHQGQVKIADFGLAKLLDQSQFGNTLTGTYQVIGTPRYMSPEQMEGAKDIDHRADIYSLGVVLYEMLTGELPLGRFDPPSQKSDVDQRLDEVVFRALEKEPTKRYQQASEVRTDVEALKQAPAANRPAKTPSPVRLPTSFDSGRVRLISFACFAVACIVLLFTQWTTTIVKVDDNFVISGVTPGYTITTFSSGAKFALVNLAGVLGVLLLPTIALTWDKPVSTARSLLISATCITLLLAALQVLLFRPVANHPAEYSGFLETIHYNASYSSPIDQLMDLRFVRITVIPSFGCYVALMLGTAFGFVSIIDFKQAVRSSWHQADGDPTEMAAAPAAWMRLCAIGLPIAATVTMFFSMIYLMNRSGFNFERNMMLMMVWLQLIYTAIAAPLIWLGSVHLKNTHSKALAMTGAVLCVLPFHVGWPIGLIVGVWAITVITQPQVSRAMSQKRFSVEQLSEHVRRRGFWLTVLGALQVLCCVGVLVIVFITLLANGGGPDFGFALVITVSALTLPMTFSILLVYGGLRTKSLRSEGWAKTAAVAAMIPATPFWLLGLPLGLSTLVLLGSDVIQDADAKPRSLFATSRESAGKLSTW